MFYLIWNVVLAVIAAVLFGATLATLAGLDRGTNKIIALCCFLAAIFVAITDIFIWCGIALGVP